MTDQFIKAEDALKSYDASVFRTPDGYTSDILLFTVKNEANRPKLHILLIERAKMNAEGKPNMEGGKWAIPGGFVDEHEDAHTAGIRELEEETGLTDIPLTAFGVYDKPGRDPRGWIISRAHYAFVPLEALEKRAAGDDAQNVALFSIEKALELPLAFDHKDILTDAFESITKEILLTTKVSDFLPKVFSEVDLYAVLEGCTKQGTLPPFEEFASYLNLLPFIEQDEAGNYRFVSEARAHSIFF
ncbi:NUDIX domain-containing protein [Listeria ilorinensis]|uniref:NUDIX domain-containing protein n=1 Tax=Listeria ilorinensis TaxID=2867439 RepID=UPI001EF54732|nr:NUDIX hydrolase [Listeria ilorinensis]